MLLAASTAGAQTGNIRTVGLSRDEAIARWPKLQRLERAKLERAGLRIIEGKYLTLITDLRPSPAVDELVEFADAATLKLADYFDLPLRALDRWRVRACLMGDQQVFLGTGLLEVDRADFPHGLSIGYRLWLRDQTSDYYRRHLLLHELTHSFMSTQLGGCGPSWYMESMAELIGTHTWRSESSELQIAIIPPDRDGFDMWGRTKLIREAVDAGKPLPMAAVLKIDNRRPLTTNQYAWCWALGQLLDTHPRYRDRWRALRDEVLRPDFNQRFLAAFADDWSHVDTEWRLMVTTVDYGRDIEREAIEFEFGRKLTGPQARCKVATDRGWQSSSWHVEAGNRYKMQATGRFTIAHEADGTPWPCEANGVTLAYHDGRPLGQLLAVVDPRAPTKISRQGGTNAFLEPTPLGTETIFEPRTSGTLYLRVNDSPADLAENEGTLDVTLRQLPQ